MKNKVFLAFTALLLTLSVFTGCKKSNGLTGNEFKLRNKVTEEAGDYTLQIFFNNDNSVTIQQVFDSDMDDVLATFGKYEVSGKTVTFVMDDFREFKNGQDVTNPEDAAVALKVYNTYINYKIEKDVLYFMNDEGENIPGFSGFIKAGKTDK